MIVFASSNGALTGQVNRMRTIVVIAALTLLAVASSASAGIDDAVLNSNAEDPCPAIQVMPWPPYVVIVPDCIGSGPLNP